jgi:hypothetical protein
MHFRLCAASLLTCDTLCSLSPRICSLVIMSSLSLSKPIDIHFSIPSYLLPLGAFSLGLLATYRFKGKNGSPEPLDHVVRSPLKALLPTLSVTEKHGLPYPPDLFPGARDVQTPFGSIRVYEWGPESGRKVLFVHGISTPCLSLGLIAGKLADNGCRVMLFGKSNLAPSSKFYAHLIRPPRIPFSQFLVFLHLPGWSINLYTARYDVGRSHMYANHSEQIYSVGDTLMILATSSTTLVYTPPRYS